MIPMYSLFVKHFVNQMDLKQLHILTMQKHKQKNPHPLSKCDSRQASLTADCSGRDEQQSQPSLLLEDDANKQFEGSRVDVMVLF